MSISSIENGSATILPGIDSYKPFPGFPEISDQYFDAIHGLISHKSGNITHFYGAPIDRSEGNVWLSPVEVHDGQGPSYFQILYANMRPEDAYGNAEVPVTLIDLDEASYKLTPEGHQSYEAMRELLGTLGRHIFVRPVSSGMAYYPANIAPDMMCEKRTKNHLEQLVREMGWSEPRSTFEVPSLSLAESENFAQGILTVVQSRVIPFGSGQVYAYGVRIPDDPWGYYDLFTTQSLDKVPESDLNLRIDSGCDTGQLYDDHGCECREQLHTALIDFQKMDGVGAVLHIPSQDGRGFGMATKMETEGLKQGTVVMTNKEDLTPLDTITAAVRLLGRNFDIRTYDGAGRVLGALGVTSVTLTTDNRIKLAGLAERGIQVSRRATGTTGANGSREHVAAKHQHPMYKWSDTPH